MCRYWNPELLGGLGDCDTGAVEGYDEATYGDRFAAMAEPSPENLAMVTHGERTTYRSVVPHAGWPAGARVSLAGDLVQVLESTLAAWAVDGSVVLSRNGALAGIAGRSERLASEAVTLELT